ncbi:MAG: hypothetical protein HRT57_15500 [Crocinitomicaceae bacterium]|nr:hypothetical protein [Crocinitomicaceae bacterium]
MAEVVIALIVIAICFSIASLVFVRATLTATNFQNVKQQTEIQCMIWRQLQLNETPLELEEIQMVEATDENQDSILIFTYSALNDKLLWNQQFINFE